MNKNKYLSILYYFTIFLQVVYASIENLKECKYEAKNKCVSTSGTKFNVGEKCITEEGKVYRIFNENSGFCVLVDYVDRNGEQKQIKKFNEREDDDDEFDSTYNDESGNYYLYKDIERVTLESDINNFGYLFFCEDSIDESCTLINEVGYYISNNVVYSCENRNSNNNCKIYTVKNSCGIDTIGDIINKEGEFSICINGIKDIKLSEEGDYVVNHRNNNIFGTSDENQYALVTIKNNSVVLNKLDNNKYLYADKTSNKIVRRGSCPNQYRMDDLLEFRSKQNGVYSTEETR